MKKWIALLLAVAMLFTLCACGPKTDNNDNQNNDNNNDGAKYDTLSIMLSWKA